MYFPCKLEKIRFSITRLKQSVRLYCLSHPLLAWKDKILDYEIETLKVLRMRIRLYSLEKIRFSITRLKLRTADRLPLRWAIMTWKDKILDYEIET